MSAFMLCLTTLTFLRLAKGPGVFVCYMSSDDPNVRMTQAFG
jgi:hypothetical protein